MNRVLIYEPDAVLRSAYEAFFEKKAIWAVSVEDPQKALESLRKQLFHLCLFSVENTAHADLLFQLKNARPATSLLVTSPSSDPALVVACMRAGASNFLSTSPGAADPQSLASVFGAIEEQLSRSVPDPEGLEEIQTAFPHFVGRHPRMLEIFQTILSIKNSEPARRSSRDRSTGSAAAAAANGWP
jgi:DNA-binding NtrC family response regulator